MRQGDVSNRPGQYDAKSEMSFSPSVCFPFVIRRIIAKKWVVSSFSFHAVTSGPWGAFRNQHFAVRQRPVHLQRRGCHDFRPGNLPTDFLACGSKLKIESISSPRLLQDLRYTLKCCSWAQGISKPWSMMILINMKKSSLWTFCIGTFFYIQKISG